MTEHQCEPPDPGEGPVVTSFTCPDCGRTWLMNESGKWTPVEQD